jgi:hypothetical protein
MARTHRTAIEAGHDRLYHYERFRPEWLATTLREQKIHCSNPDNLNDPWDCRPCFNARSLQEPAGRQEFIAWFHRQDLPTDLAFLRRALLAILEFPGGDDLFIDSYLNILSQQMWGRKIYCLTPNSLSTRMWSHYAQNHRGICIEFGLDNYLFRWAAEVTYRAEYPDWRPEKNMGEGASEILLTKSDDWANEKEFRLVSAGEFAPEDHPLALSGDYFALPPGALLSVIVGCEGDYDAVKKIVNENSSALSVKRVVRVPNSYRLTLNPVPDPT